MKKIILLVFLIFNIIVAEAQWTTSGNNIYNSNTGNVGIGTSAPAYSLDVRNGNIYTTGSVFVDGGDLVLKRTTLPYGYLVRPNISGYKKLMLAVEGGGPLEDFYVNSAQSYFAGKAEVGEISDPTKYGALQLTRPADQGDNRFHLSFIRAGNNVAGMGYARNNSSFGIWYALDNQGTPLLGLSYDQKVGIGTSTPAEKLTIAGPDGNINIGNTIFPGYNGIWLNGSANGNDYNFLSKASDYNLYINRPSGASIFFRQANGTQMVLSSNGSLGIGTTATGDVNYKLFVETGIRTRKVKVDQTSWPDYVFEKNYQLPGLQQVEQFIQQYKHLPNIPSAKEIERNGLDLGEGQNMLMKKIEELTLYIIHQQKEIEDLKSQNRGIDELRKEINAIKKELDNKN